MKKMTSADGYCLILFQWQNGAYLGLNCFRQMPSSLRHKYKRGDRMHDHQAGSGLFSIGLWGRYLEKTKTGTKTRAKTWRAPWFRWIPGRFRHSVHRVNGKTCYTLVLFLP